MIRSIKVIRLRCICRALEHRGLSLHAIADQACVGVTDLRRLMEFGSMLEGDGAERLISLYARASVTTSFQRRYGTANQRLLKFQANEPSGGPRYLIG